METQRLAHRFTTRSEEARTARCGRGRRTDGRRLVLLSLLALLLGVSGAAAPTGLAANPPDTRVAGIDVDATTIPELQELMNAHRLKSVAADPVLPPADQEAQPDAQRGHHRQPDGARRRAERRTRRAVTATTGRCSGFRSSSRTTSTPPACRRQPAPGRSPGARPTTRSSRTKLKAAGAIIIGKANLSEWANFRSGPSSSGWSGIGGQTNMPYVLDRNPCGSSSGSGVVAAADLAVAAVGTETDGSIVCPSGANGVVGIKPTLGLWSRAGVIPISADQDTAGPMARNVTDAAVLLGAATGVDPNDAATADADRPRLHRLHPVPRR